MNSHLDGDSDTLSKSQPPLSQGFKPQHNGLIVVQPPRREDLQPSYAQTLQGDEDTNHGWYGVMSKQP